MQRISIDVKRIGTTPRQFKKQVDIHFLTTKEATIKLAEESAIRMRNIISSQKKKDRGTVGRLEKAIDIHTLINTKANYSIGVGKIAQLPRYWAVVNFGGRYTIPEIVPKRRKVLKFSGNYSVSFPYLGASNVLASDPYAGETVYTPRTKARPQVISPMNYVQKTIDWVNSVARIHYTGWTRKITIT